MTKYTDMWDIIEDRYKDEYGPSIEEYKQSVNMRELVMIGRAGYGMWQGGELLCRALMSAGKSGKVIFVMPGERQNSPTRSFVRYADVPVTFPGSHIYKPDHMIISDIDLLEFQSLVFDIDTTAFTRRMDEKGLVILDSPMSPDQIKTKTPLKPKLVTVDATQIALDILEAVFHRNTALIGAYLAVTKVMPLESFEKAILEYKDPRGRLVYSGKKGELNIKAARAGYESVKM